MKAVGGRWPATSGGLTLDIFPTDPMLMFVRPTWTPLKPQIRRLHASRCSSGFLREFFGLESGVPAPNDRDLFVHMDESPSEDIRRRAAFIKARAPCPVTGLPIAFTCPKSGVPTHHDEAAWASHRAYFEEQRWLKLKYANMFEEDLRSGRDFPELDFPGEITDDQVANLLNWDTFFYTRDFPSMDTPFEMAMATKMLTYPLTVAGVLHEFSPYSLKPRGPMTLEGLKSAAALRYTLFPEDRLSSWTDRPMRLFVLGARMESQLPWHAWQQMMHLFPTSNIELVFIGPEACYDRQKHQYLKLERAMNERVTHNLGASFHTEYFHTLNDAGDFFPYDPYLDAFFLFHPGLGAPEAMDQWKKTVPGLLESKCPVFVTGFHEQDSEQDWRWLHEHFGSELDVLIEPTENVFRSTKWEFNDLNPQELYQLNQRLFAFRGKRYHIQT